MQIITTEDGSHTLFSEEFNEVYHSRHGAIEESRQVAIRMGLDDVAARSDETIEIFELGFGTGLNALLTMLEAEKRKIKIDYTTIELFPVDIATIKALNYTEQLGFAFCYGPYHSLHLVRPAEKHPITPYFSFTKINDSIFNHAMPANQYALILFDAFGPVHQPEMWTADMFRKMYHALRPNGVLVTYCSKVTVQRAMKEAGFSIEKVPGPPGKREMLRARKIM